VDIVVDEKALGQVFYEYFGFPAEFSFHWMIQAHLSSRAGTVHPLVVGLPTGLCLTPPY
jgi:hypothetical protein